MVRLSGADYRKVLDVLREAGDVDGPNPFPEPVLHALRRLVPCDVVAYHERHNGKPALVYVGEPRGPMTNEIRAAASRYDHQCPLAPAHGALMYSDYATQREFHRLDLYQEALRPLGIEDMIRLWLDPAGADGARVEFDRAERDFSERDRGVLDVIRPHLEQLRRRSARRRAPSALPALTPREREVLELLAEGHTNREIARALWLSPGTVRKHLENVYEKLEVHTRTAAAAALRCDL